MNRLLLILVTIANNQYLCTYYLPITLLRFHTCNIMLRDDVFVWTMVFSLKKKNPTRLLMNKYVCNYAKCTSINTLKYILCILYNGVYTRNA